MKLLSIIAIALILSPYATAEKIENETNVEKIGDWIISNEIDVKNSTVILEGNLYIRGGSLRVINSTLYIKSYSTGQFSIYVENGIFSVINSTITAYYPDNRYNILVYSDGYIDIHSSVIEHSGYGPEKKSCLYVEGDIDISDSVFKYDYYPMWAHGIKNKKIENISALYNNFAFYLEDSQNIEFANSTVRNTYGMGIWLKGGSHNAIKSTFVENIYSKDSHAEGIVIENESSDTIEENDIRYTSREGIFIKNSENSSILGNHFIWNGVAQVHLKNASNSTVENNIMENSYKGMLIEGCYNTHLQGNNISTKFGISLVGSENTTLRDESFENVKYYALLSYSSNITRIYSARFFNVTYYLYLKNSRLVFIGHIYSDKYRIYGESRLYLSRLMKVYVYDENNSPVSGVVLKLRFLRENIDEKVTDRNGEAFIIAPYVAHTQYKKIYSWCEIYAESNMSFEENPIRFYSSTTRRVVFREKVGQIHVSLSTDKKEVLPGERVNITVIAEKDRKFIKNATLQIYVDKKPIFEKNVIFNGTYHISIEVPQFNGSIKISAVVEWKNMEGNASTSLVKPTEIYEENAPVKSSSGFPYVPYIVALAVLILLSAVLLKRRKKGGFEGYKPLPKDNIEVER